MNLNKIPATVVTGFLGSGKTTLLTHLLKHNAGQRIAVLVNEFGELDIDADLLSQCGDDCDDEHAAASDDEGVYELANGCICCTVEEEFLPVMKRIVARRDSIDRILIETSGLALPKPLVQAFSWPEIQSHCTVDSVITVVDGVAAAQGRFAQDPEQVQQQRLADDNLDHDSSLEELFDDQLQTADMVLINKSDGLDAAQTERLNARLDEQLTRPVKTLAIQRGQLDPALVLGLEAASEQRMAALQTHHDAHHDHEEDHSHAHEHFDSRVIETGDVDSERLIGQLERLMAEQPIYRVKGFASIPGKPMRQVLQGVGRRLERYFDRPWGDDEARRTRLVFIGRGLDEATLQQAIDEAG